MGSKIGSSAQSVRYLLEIQVVMSRIQLDTGVSSSGQKFRMKRAISILKHMIWLPLVVQMVKNLPTVQETQVQSLGQEDPLEKGMASHSNILVWENPWTEDPGEIQFMGSQRVGHN